MLRPMQGKQGVLNDIVDAIRTDTLAPRHPLY
jgi:hypothetical protein